MSDPKITTLCYVEHEGKYLMMHRNKKENDVNEGKWIGLGGHLIPGETVTECVKREVIEESSLSLNTVRFRGTIYFSCKDDPEYMFLFTTDDYEGDVRDDCPEGELEWIDKSDIGLLELWEGDKKFLPLLGTDTPFFHMSLIYDDDGNLLDEHRAPELYQDEDVLRKYGRIFPTLGERAIIVTGKHSARANGSLADLSETLDYYGISYCLFDEVEENPSVETVMKGRDKGLAFGADFVIGVGGGSPMDAAKGVALMIKNADRDADYLYEAGNKTDALPVLCIPTTCGTGSEATAVSVLSRPAQKLKGSIPYRIMPEFGLSDVSYLRYTDMQIIRNTAMDAFCHLAESYVNSAANDLSRAISLLGLEMFKDVKDVLMSEDGLDDDNLNELLTISSLAGLAIAIDGTAVPHAMSYSFTLDENRPHGPSCAYYLPGYLDAAGSIADPVWKASGIADAHELKELFLHLYDFSGVLPESLERSVEQISKNEAKLGTSPFPLDKDILERIAGFMKN